MTDESQVRTSVLESLRQAQLTHSPFSYYQLENVFPDDFYQSLRDHLPSLKQLTELKHPASKRSDKTYARRILEVRTNQDLEQIPSHHRSPWITLWNLGQHPDYQHQILKMLQPALDKRFTHPITPKDITVKMVISRDLDQYAIQVHPDTARKIVTMQFYLPPDDQYIDQLGTLMHKKIPKEKRKSNQIKHRYQVIDQMKFGRNRGYGFAVNQNSFHSVNKIHVPTDYSRDSVTLVFHSKPHLRTKDIVYQKEIKRGKPAI